jgi:hypothetical protein
MIIQLFIFALAFFILAAVMFFRKKKVLGIFFIVLGIFATVIGSIVVWLYPHTLPF